MKNIIRNIGGLIAIYAIIVFGVLLLNLRFSYINEIQSNNESDTYIAMNN